MRYSFDGADAPTQKETQYYEMVGNRGIWHNGWKAVTEHGPLSGMGNFDDDRWQLFHTDDDRSELNDLADQHPERVDQLKDLWMQEAVANNVLPLNDLAGVGKDMEEMHKLMFKVPVPPSGQYTYYPGTSPVPEASAANTHSVSFKVLAQVVVEPGTQGVIFAQGARFGGHALYVKDGKVRYAYNFLGVPPIQLLEADLPAAGRHVIGVDFVKERVGENHEVYGTATLYVDENTIDSKEIRTIAAFYSLCGEGLCIGYDSSDPVSPDYSGRFDYTGGEIVKVVFDVADDAYVDVERHIAAAMSRD